MLQKIDLESNFANPVDIGAGIIRCEDETPRSIYYYYTKPAPLGSGIQDLLVVSENKSDDDFVRLMLGCIPSQTPSPSLSKHPIPLNKYGFSSVLLAPKNYHSYFKGVLDDRRENLVLCLPIHHCEFSGNEAVQEFVVMRREVVPTLDWERPVCPKIVFRFDNPRTGGGTGNREVIAKYDLVLREIDNINGVADGFLEIENYKAHTIEILSPEEDRYILIRGRNDDTRERVIKSVLLEKLHEFLTGCPNPP